MKRRSTLSELALRLNDQAMLGFKARGGRDERIKIEGVRNGTSSSLSSEATTAPEAALFSVESQVRAGSAEAKQLKAELAKLEDADLLRRFQQGEEIAFYVIFERRHKEIYTHCFRMCSGDAEKANDAFQDTFVKVFTRKDLFTDATNGRAWLYRIATNTCLNQLRYDRRHPHEAIDDNVNSYDPQMQPDFGTEQDSLRASLERAVAKLPVELREPFLLRELEEFSYEDAAAQLGISIAACRQRVYRAKQILREELEEVVTGEPKKKSWFGRK